MEHSRFFFEQYAEITERWARILNDIPSTRSDSSLIYEAVENGRLGKFGEFQLIDSLASSYGYTHEEASLISWSTFMTIIAYNRERAYIEYRTEQLMKEQ